MARKSKKRKLIPIEEPAEASESEDQIVRLESGVDNKAKKSPEPEAPKKVKAARIRPPEPTFDDLLEERPSEDLDGWESDSETSSRASIPLGWVFLGILIFVGAIGWSLLQLGRSGERKEVVVVQAFEALEDEQKAEREARLQVDRIEDTIRSFLGASSVEEMLPYVRHPERVRKLMEDHYRRNPLVETNLEEIFALVPLVIENRAAFWAARFEFNGGLTEQLLLEVFEDGQVKIDWESYVVYQPIDWDEFALEKGEGSGENFRVSATLDNLYSHEFSDSDIYQCFRLSAPKSNEILFGYVKKDSKVGREMLEIFEGADDRAVIYLLLKLRFPVDRQSPSGVEIIDLLSPRWMYVDSPSK